MKPDQKEYQNVTLSLPKSLLKKFRVYAATRNQSMTSLMTDAIQKMVSEKDERERANKRFLARLQNPPNLGTGGKITWTREDLYER